MSLNLTWSRRRRRRRPMSPRRRYHDQVRVYAPREGAAAVPRRRRLRRVGRRLQARARRTVASTSTRKAPASRSSTHGYVLTTSARCRTRASLVVLERHAPASYGPLLAATVVASGEELDPRWLDVSAHECVSVDGGGGGTRMTHCGGRRRSLQQRPRRNGRFEGAVSL